jgi:glutaminyl-tRNA synthetase
MVKNGGEPRDLVASLGLQQVSDPGALAPLVDQVIAANAAKADEYRAGKTGLLGFFVGNVMRQSGGKANPELVSNLVRERLGS